MLGNMSPGRVNGLGRATRYALVKGLCGPESEWLFSRGYAAHLTRHHYLWRRASVYMMYGLLHGPKKHYTRTTGACLSPHAITCTSRKISQCNGME